MKTVYDFSVKTNSGQETTLKQYDGKYLLIVNTASRCGFTPQYAGLEELQKKFGDRLVVLGFPCNQFGSQEPGTDEEIKGFCDLNYKVTFPLFSKVDVNGESAHPLFVFLKESLPGILGTKDVKWNFTKFLVGPNGEPLDRFAPNTSPEKIGEELQEKYFSRK